jgi:hypothetical protein
MITRVRTTFRKDGSMATQETETWDGDWRVSTELVTFEDGPSGKPMKEEHRRMVATRRKNQQAKREEQLNKYAANLSWFSYIYSTQKKEYSMKRIHVIIAALILSSTAASAARLVDCTYGSTGAPSYKYGYIGLYQGIDGKYFSMFFGGQRCPYNIWAGVNSRATCEAAANKHMSALKDATGFSQHVPQFVVTCTEKWA